MKIEKKQNKKRVHRHYLVSISLSLTMKLNKLKTHIYFNQKKKRKRKYLPSLSLYFEMIKYFPIQKKKTIRLFYGWQYQAMMMIFDGGGVDHSIAQTKQPKIHIRLKRICKYYTHMRIIQMIKQFVLFEKKEETCLKSRHFFSLSSLNLFRSSTNDFEI